MDNKTVAHLDWQAEAAVFTCTSVGTGDCCSCWLRIAAPSQWTLQEAAWTGRGAGNIMAVAQQRPTGSGLQAGICHPDLELPVVCCLSHFAVLIFFHFHLLSLAVWTTAICWSVNRRYVDVKQQPGHYVTCQHSSNAPQSLFQTSSPWAPVYH